MQDVSSFGHGDSLADIIGVDMSHSNDNTVLIMFTVTLVSTGHCGHCGQCQHGYLGPVYQRTVMIVVFNSLLTSAASNDSTKGPFKYHAPL